MSRKFRNSSPFMTGQTGFHHMYLYSPAYRAANKLLAQEAQQKIEERHRKAAEPKKRAGGHKYSQEIVDEIKSMYAAGWPPREIIRVMEMPKGAVMSILRNTVDGMSAAQAKKAR